MTKNVFNQTQRGVLGKCSSCLWKKFHSFFVKGLLSNNPLSEITISEITITLGNLDGTFCNLTKEQVQFFIQLSEKYKDIFSSNWKIMHCCIKKNKYWSTRFCIHCRRFNEIVDWYKKCRYTLQRLDGTLDFLTDAS